MKKTYFIKEYILVLFLIYLGFFIDTINAVLIKILGEHSMISLVNRMFTEIVFIGLLWKNNIRSPLLYLLVGFLFSFVGMILTMPNGLTSMGDLLQNIVIINKVLYFFIVIHIIYFYFFNKRELIFNFFEMAYTLFIVSILIGFIFQIPFLEAYPQEKRFGYKGFIVTQNEAVGIFMIGIFYFSAKFDQYRQKKDIAYIFFILIAGLLTGSKANLFFLSLSFLLLYFSFITKSKKAKNSFLLLFPLLILIDWEKVINIFKTTINYVTAFYAKGMDIMSIVLSGRNWRVEDMIKDISTLPYTTYNFIFGGFNFSKMGTEMDLFDLFQLFGFFGTLVFYFVYIRVLRNYSRKYNYINLFIFLWLIVSTLGGHLIYNAVIPIYLSIMILKFYDVQEYKKCQIKR